MAEKSHVEAGSETMVQFSDNGSLFCLHCNRSVEKNDCEKELFETRHVTCLRCFFSLKKVGEYKRLSQSKAVSEFGVTAKELSAQVDAGRITVLTCPNPRGFGNPMKLYYEFQVKQAAIRKFGSTAAWMDAVEAKTEKRIRSVIGDELLPLNARREGDVNGRALPRIPNIVIASGEEITFDLSELNVFQTDAYDKLPEDIKSVEISEYCGSEALPSMTINGIEGDSSEHRDEKMTIVSPHGQEKSTRKGRKRKTTFDNNKSRDTTRKQKPRKAFGKDVSKSETQQERTAMPKCSDHEYGEELKTHAPGLHSVACKHCGSLLEWEEI